MEKRQSEVSPMWRSFWQETFDLGTKKVLRVICRTNSRTIDQELVHDLGPKYVELGMSYLGHGPYSKAPLRLVYLFIYCT